MAQTSLATYRQKHREAVTAMCAAVLMEIVGIMLMVDAHAQHKPLAVVTIYLGLVGFGVLIGIAEFVYGMVNHRRWRRAWQERRALPTLHDVRRVNS